MKRFSVTPLGLVAIGLVVASLATPGMAQPAAPDQVASVEALKSEAFKEARDGHFQKSNSLLSQAAELSHDPLVTQMAAWTGRFETQREQFATERHKQYEKRVGDVQLLLKNQMPDYALDAAAGAYLLADDKKGFDSEPWVRDLVTKEIARAEQFDQSEQWIKSLRIYSDLGSIQPAEPKWKDRLKLSTRRVRVLALYTPTVLKSLQDTETKERDVVERLLNPTTQPATKPTTEASPDSDTFKIDWHDTLRGIRFDMLWEAMLYARNQYYRDTSYQALALGGLNGLRVVATTKGLEQAFPKLADEKARDSFLATVDECVDLVKEARSSGDGPLHTTFDKLKTANAQTVQLPEEVLVSEFADGAFGELDPFSSMLWPSDLEEFNRTTGGEFSGVGIQIQSDPDGNLKVTSPLEDTPAYKAGIKAGDIIARINGKSAKGISLNQAVRTITGPTGTTVVLTVRGSDLKTREYTIRRETIKVASVKGYIHKPGGGWDWLIDPEQKIGYMRMTNFTQFTAEELNSAIDQLKDQGARAIILDLRYNPGGLLAAATKVADKFLRDGVIVSTRPDRETGNPPTVAVAKPEDSDCDLPLVILINQYSASASEIVSGALKDQKRAILVGERTFGKGSVQMLFPLTDHSAYLKLTTSHYYLPSGRCIHREENSTEWGVDPDVTVEMTPEQMRSAIDARQDLDILHDADKATPAQGEQPKLQDAANQADTTPPKQTVAVGGKKDLLSSDPQLSAALLLLRLKINGASL